MSMYATRADLDALLQALQSNPGEKGRPYFRGVPVVVDRSYLGVAGPASDQWDSFYSYSGKGGLLYPDRQIEWRLIMGASNISGRTLWYQVRFRLNDQVFFTSQAGLANGEDVTLSVDWRIIATGGNAGQLIQVAFGAGTPAISSASEDLADTWTITVEATWRDDDGEPIPGPDTGLTLPADAYFFRYHALAVLT